MLINVNKAPQRFPLQGQSGCLHCCHTTAPSCLVLLTPLPASTPSLSFLSEQVFQGCKHSVLHVHSSKYSAIPALRHSHKTNLERSIVCLPLHMALCGTWLALGSAWPQPSPLYEPGRGKQAHRSFRSG